LNISQAEVDSNRIESWEKEILATTIPSKEQVINYDVWFNPDPSAAYWSLSRFIPPAPKHNIRIRRLFSAWKESLSGRLLFPQMQSNKTVARSSAQIYDTKIHGMKRKE